MKVDVAVLYLWVAIGIFVEVFFLGFGYYFGGMGAVPMITAQEDLTYDTCSYANLLTELVNKQSALLESVMGKPEFNLTRLEEINCTELIGG